LEREQAFCTLISPKNKTATTNATTTKRLLFFVVRLPFAKAYAQGDSGVPMGLYHGTPNTTQRIAQYIVFNYKKTTIL
jgi:hypothetical protein